MTCPEIEALLAGAPDALDHASGCAGCAAVLSLAKVRDERVSAREEHCVETELALALEAEGLLDATRTEALRTHLERCADCNELAVRLSTSREPAPRSQSSRWPLAVGWAASVAAAAAVGALAARATLSPTGPELAREPPAPAEPVRPGAALEPTPPTPCPTPAPEAPKQLAPLPPPRPSTPELINPWAQPSAPRPRGTGYLSVSCVPGCDAISIDGRAMGPSPLVRVPVPVGTAKLELQHGSVRKRLVVQIIDGQVSARRIEMRARTELLDPWR